MKKQTVTLLLSLLVVLALLGLMIFLMVRFQSGEEQEEQTVGSSQEETVLMQVAADAINTLSIENPSDSFTLVNEGDGFVVEGLEGVSVSSLNVNNLVDLFAPADGAAAAAFGRGADGGGFRRATHAIRAG